MFGRTMVFNLVAGVAYMAAPAFSQSEEPSKNEVSVQALGSFVKSTTENGVQNSATNSGGVLASYRFFFDRHNGFHSIEHGENDRDHAQTGLFGGGQSFDADCTRNGH